MRYTKIEMCGETSVEHTIEGDFEEVLALFTKLESKDAVEYHGASNPWFTEDLTKVMKSGGVQEKF